MFALLSVACVFVESQPGSGVSATEERSVGSFDRVDNASVIDVSVEVSSEGDGSVTVTCDDNLLDGIRTRATGATLVIDHPIGVNIAPAVPCSVVVRVPQLQALSASGTGATAADGELAGLSDVDASGTGPVSISGDVPDLDRVDASGAGDVEISGIASVAPFTVDVSGVGRVELSGTGTEVDLLASGTGALDARDLVVAVATIDASGTGAVWITATDAVSIDLSGTGDVHVYGDPADVDTQVSGIGQVVFEE